MQHSPAYVEVADYLNHLERFDVKPGLERIRALMERFGQPQLKYPVVLVGGTNGKGSTVEFIAGILRCAGYKVGVYTSPHIYRFNERIRIVTSGSSRRAGELFDGEIADDDLLRLLNTVRPVAEDLARTTDLRGATTFEILTAMGFLYFAEQQVDLAVVEVGLGGRWDATNLTEPIVSVITNVSLDHTDRLGDTVEKIAREKMEIARPGRVLVTGETDPKLLQVFREFCAERGAALLLPEAEFHVDSYRFDCGIPYFAAMSLKIGGYQREITGDQEAARQGLFAAFQERNLSLAISAVIHLKRSGWKIERQYLERACASAAIPGRFEFLSGDSFPLIIADAANNPAGMEALRSAFIRFRDWALADREAPFKFLNLVLVLGISADKAVEEMVSIIAPLARTVIATQADNRRAAPAERIAEAARKHCAEVRVAVPVREAVRQALDLAEPNDLVLITGSFFVLGEIDREELTG